MKKRRFALAALCAALACTLIALCGCSGSNNYQPTLKEATVAAPVIGEDGTLRVGVNTENPPLAGMGSGKIIGIDVDIASAIADELGLKISVVDVGSDPASAIADGKVDIVMGLDNSNSESEFWTSSSYLPTGIAIFATSADAGVPQAGDSVTFAAQTSSKSAWAVTNEFGDAALKSTDSLSEAFAALQSGEVQYVAADAIIGLYAAHGANDGAGIDVTIVGMLMKPSGYCMGISSANTDLQAAAGDALTRLVENGTITVIERKWLGTTVDLENLTVVGGGTDGADDASGDNANGDGDNGEGTGDGAGDAATTGDATGDGGTGDGDTADGDTAGDGDTTGDGDTAGDGDTSDGDAGAIGDDTGVGTVPGLDGTDEDTGNE